MKKVITILILLFTIAFRELHAETIQNDSLRFSGRITLSSGGTLNMKMSVNYGKDDFFGGEDANWTILPTIDGQGLFKFNLPNFKKPYMFFIALTDGVNGERIFNHYYYTEPGDNIRMTFVIGPNSGNLPRSKSTTFTGRGAQKYKVAWELQEPFYFKNYLQEIRAIDFETPIASIADLKGRTNNFIDILRKYKLKKEALISSPLISAKSKKILKYGYGAYFKGLSYEWQMRNASFYDKNPVYRKQIASIYFDYITEFYEKPDSIARYSGFYMDELLRRILFELRLINDGVKPSVQQVFSTISKDYVGDLRDRILGQWLKDDFYSFEILPDRTGALDSVVSSAPNLVGLPYVKAALTARALTMKRLNQPVFNGEFIGLNGEKFNLSSLSGRVVLLDVWFDGCFGCAEFHKNFEKVYPQFKNNKNFAVLSVNVDDKKSRWIKGINSKLYTSKDYIQVTTAKGFDHPFMKYYNITSASYVMVIGADGKVLPKAKTYEEVATQIFEALNKMDSSY